ncbi:MAG: hypothetical protein KO206_00950 [Methanomicrobiaceae archaeon]|uniref:Uncharacterized protein n=1 Tax=hydrocarbon metagenome TaxID=938273 RepID=A0A0W8FJ04_9ZZZZ|nr:hypothetical protein [Methanomicrobiaceae archaeon]MDD5419988.1 hypothetical protein [Methanomicrobiaceae archaeon]
MSLRSWIERRVGWCPHERMRPDRRGAGSAPPDAAAAAGEGGRALRKEWFVVDSILKEEVMRSIAVWFASFMAIGLSDMAGYVHVPGFWPFILAMVPTGIYVALMTRYRRREHLYSPYLPAIVSHMMKSRSTHGESRVVPARSAARTAVDILTVVIFSLVYIFASASYPVLRPLWILVLAGATLALGHLLFDGGAAGANPVRIAILYAVLLPLLFVRAFVLGSSSVASMAAAVLVVGGVSCGVLLAWRLTTVTRHE